MSRVNNIPSISIPERVKVQRSKGSVTVQYKNVEQKYQMGSVPDEARSVNQKLEDLRIMYGANSKSYRNVLNDIKTKFASVGMGGIIQGGKIVGDTLPQQEKVHFGMEYIKQLDKNFNQRYLTGITKDLQKQNNRLKSMGIDQTIDNIRKISKIDEAFEKLFDFYEDNGSFDIKNLKDYDFSDMPFLKNYDISSEEVGKLMDRFYRNALNFRNSSSEDTFKKAFNSFSQDELEIIYKVVTHLDKVESKRRAMEQKELEQNSNQLLREKELEKMLFGDVDHIGNSGR